MTGLAEAGPLPGGCGKRALFNVAGIAADTNRQLKTRYNPISRSNARSRQKLDRVMLIIGDWYQLPPPVKYCRAIFQRQSSPTSLSASAGAKVNIKTNAIARL